MPRWNLSDLLILVAVFGIAFAGCVLFWLPLPSPNFRPFLSAFLVCLSLASMGSFFAKPRWRRAFQGFAVFGWFQLVCVLWGGFGVHLIRDAERVAEGSQIGMLFGVLTGILAWWLFEPPSTGGQRDLPA
jgi:hypothetical protein